MITKDCHQETFQPLRRNCLAYQQYSRCSIGKHSKCLKSKKNILRYNNLLSGKLLKVLWFIPSKMIEKLLKVKAHNSNSSDIEDEFK